MASAENQIGQGACPVCGATKAKFTLSKSGLACMTCNSCNCQIFARSGTSDEKLRARISVTPPAPAPATAPAPPARQIAPAVATAPAPEKNPPDAALPRKGFGLLGAWA